MTHGRLLSVICAAALAAAPAMAQHSVSGTIGTVHAASASATAPTTSAAAPAEPPLAVAPAATAATSAAQPAAAAPGTALAMTLPPPAPNNASASASGGLLQTTLALTAVLALLAALAWLLKRYGPKHLHGSAGHIKLVGALNIGARERILLLEVGEQWIVVGASPGRINALTTMARQPDSVTPTPAAMPGNQFAQWLKQTIDQRNGS